MAPHFEIKGTGESVGFDHPTNGEWAETKHQRAAMLAKERKVTLTEVADDKGEPCTKLPQEYKPK